MATIILKDSYKVEKLNEGIYLSEAIDGVAYSATVKLVETNELKNIGLVKGDSIVISDVNFETKKVDIIFRGVVWEIRKSGSIIKHLDLVCKERTIYMEESEDEYLFQEGTATQRIKQYCNDWGIPIGSLAATNITLIKNIYRKNTILDMMLKDLKETAQKGGKLFKCRMTDKFNLIEVGSNSTVWKLESILKDMESISSLDGIVTQVKVLGKQEDDAKSPVIGVYKNNTSKYGTFQKIVQDEKVENSSDAETRANTLFNTGDESIKVTCLDINTIRAGDRVSLNGVILYVIDINHNLGTPGKMTLNLASLQEIRRRFYSGYNI